MMALGFSLEQSEEALQTAGGNANVAIARLRGQTSVAFRRAGHERSASFGGERGRMAYRGEFPPRVYQVEGQQDKQKRHSVTNQYLRQRLRKGAHTAEHEMDFINGVSHDATAHHHIASMSRTGGGSVALHKRSQNFATAGKWKQQNTLRMSWGGEGVVELMANAHEQSRRRMRLGLKTYRGPLAENWFDQSGPCPARVLPWCHRQILFLVSS